jgi:hypothetical protein
MLKTIGIESMIIKPGQTLNGIYYGDDIEAELSDYMSKLHSISDCETIYPQEKHIRKKVEIPEGYNIPLDSKHFKGLPVEEQRDIALWWQEQKKRIRDGYEGMCGLQYKYFNFTHLHGAKGATKYRRHDNWMFKIMERCTWGDLKPWGIIGFGRRRFGKSSTAGCFAIEAVSRVKGGTLIMTSKTEDDAQRILIGEKVQYQYNNLPYPLKPSTLKSSTGQIYFGKREKDLAGNPTIGGLDSKIVGKTPKDTAIEGSTLIGWFHDEAPKTMNLGALVDNTLPALADADGFDREGFAYIVGVAGDFGRHGNDFITLWNGAKELKLIRVFIAGWLGGQTREELKKAKKKVEDSFLIDEYGNEDIAHNVRVILKRRKSVKKNKNLTESEKETLLRGMMQKYPLTIEEAFRSSTLSKWNTKNIDARKLYLEENPPEIFRAELEWDIPGIKVKMKPVARTGRYVYIEPPIKGQKYVTGADTFGFKQTDLGSIGVQWVYKLHNQLLSPGEKDNIKRQILMTDDPAEKMKLRLLLGNLPVAMFKSNDSNPRNFAEGMVKLCNWYWVKSESQKQVDVLVETEPSNALEYLMKKYNGKYAARSPLRIDKIPTHADLWEKWGLVKKEYWTEQMLTEIGHYINMNIDGIFFADLIRKFLDYDETSKTKKHDIVDAFGNTLIRAVDNRIIEWNKVPEKPKKEEEDVPLYNFKRG